jgi:hypothetical protein
VVIKLSDTLPDTPSSNLVCNVHGVRSEFLGIGASASKRTDAGKGDEVWTQGAYFLGKALYTKGYVDGLPSLYLPCTFPVPSLYLPGQGALHQRVCRWRAHFWLLGRVRSSGEYPAKSLDRARRAPHL